MKSQKLLALIIFVVLVAGATIASAAPKAGQEIAGVQEKLSREAKVTKEEAQATALKRAPGTVESAELEREHKRIVWSFDIRNSKGTITEVQVSAITGKVLRVEHENRKQEADEKRKEQSEKKKQK
ncbi:MAG: PepSY domain-containing protein [Acidobacteria bacterium]|nr:PepSY domain-containing protein [Acidobacteriota bacterium]